MKRLAAVIGLIALCGAAQAAEPFAQERAVWNKPSEPFHVIGPIWYVGTDDLAIFLIKTPKGDILVDGGLPESVPLIERNLLTLRVYPTDIRFLLNSHAHFDHAGGLEKLKKDTGAKLIAGASDAPILQKGRISFGPSSPIQFPPVHVDRQVHDGDTVELGGITLTAHLTPGHTPGCTSWTMPFTENGVSHTAIFYCSTTVAGNPLVNNAAYPEIVSDYRMSFEKLKAIKADVFLGAHARFFDAHGKAAKAKAGGPNPFVDPGELQRYVAASETAFNAELEKQKAAKP